MADICNRRGREQPMKTRSIWITALFLSASSMLIETIAYRQWRVFLRMDSLPFVLPMVMAGMAAGSIAFYVSKRKSASNKRAPGSTGPDFISRPLVAYAVLAPAPFLLLPLCAGAQPLASLLLQAGSIASCFFLFAVWGYVNSALFDRCHDKIFQLYIFTLLGTIFGACAGIVLMDACGAPFAISFSIAASVITAWVWVVMKPSATRKARYKTVLLPLFGIVAGFALPPASLIVFQDREPPVWFDSNSFSQLEMYPEEPLKTLRAPAVTAASPKASNVQAWRVYFDGLDFYYTNIVRYGTLEQVKFLEQDLSSLAFLLGNPGRALILGAGGGIEVIQGLLAGFREIDAVEINPLVMKAVQHANASDFMNAAGVQYHIADGRRFLHGDHPKYDLIFMPHVRSQGVAGVGNTQYMNTVELIGRCLDMIAPGGTLVIRIHFHDWASLSGTLKAALKTRPESEEWSLFLASEARKKRAYSLVFLYMGRLNAGQSRKISKFVNEGGFSWTQVDFGTLQDSSFVLTNDHPYAVNYQHLMRTRGVSAMTQTNNWAVAPVLVRLALPLGVALVTILLLMILQTRASRADVRQLLLLGGGYCASLGSGFLAAEIVLIEKAFLVIGNPTAAFGITVCCLLGGGLLALWAIRNVSSRPLAALLPKTAIFSALALSLAFFSLEKLAFVSVLPDWIRVLLAGSVIILAGALTGVLFPAGLRLLAEAEQDSIPWSWGINGAAAVVGGAGAELMAIIFGYRAALGFGAACYILAAIASRWMAGLLKTA